MVDKRVLVEGCRCILGEIQRRDLDLNSADRTLRPLVGKIRGSSHLLWGIARVLGTWRRWTDSREKKALRTEEVKPKAAYELGYVHLLRGELEEAERVFNHSALLSRGLGDSTGEGISRCLAGKVRFLCDLGAADKPTRGELAYSSILSEFGPVFEADAKSGDPRADRWAWNVSLHLFEVAFIQGDRTAAEIRYSEAMANDWARRFDQQDLLLPHQARYEMLCHRWANAVEFFRQYLARVGSDKEPTREQLAWIALDYAEALSQNGDPSGGEQLLSRALTWRSDAGNLPWQNLIRQRLSATRL